MNFEPQAKVVLYSIFPMAFLLGMFNHALIVGVACPVCLHQTGKVMGEPRLPLLLQVFDEITAKVFVGRLQTISRNNLAEHGSVPPNACLSKG